jgi:hemoglobin
VSTASVRCDVTRCDIADRDDITGLVAEFYRRAFADEVLGPIFFDVARVDLCAHVPVISDFWDTALLRAGLYHRNALRPMSRWPPRSNSPTPTSLAGWRCGRRPLRERHAGPRAELAKTQAARIAGSIYRRVSGAQASEHASIQLRHPGLEPS